MRRILVVKTSSLGDIIHQMPAMTDLRRRFPGARIGWVVEEAFAPLARLHPGVDDVIEVATRRWRRQLHRVAVWREFADFRARVRSFRAETVIDTQGLIRSALIARMAGGASHGYDKTSIREPIGARLYGVAHQVSRRLHAVERSRLLCGLALDYQPVGPPDFGLQRPAPAGGAPYAVLLHGTARASKEWREEDWEIIGREAHRRGLYPVLTWGNQVERERAYRLAQQIPGSRVFDRRPLDETGRLVGGAALAIGLDTGLLHLAAAFGVPVLALFPDTDPKLAGPTGPGEIEIVGDKGVYPPADEAVRALDRVASRSSLP